MSMTINFRLPYHRSADFHSTGWGSSSSYYGDKREAIKAAAAYQVMLLNACAWAMGLDGSEDARKLMRAQTRIICRPDQFGAFMAMRLRAGKFSSATGEAMDVHFIDSVDYAVNNAADCKTLNLGGTLAGKLVALPGLSKVPDAVLVKIADSLGLDPNYVCSEVMSHPQADVVMGRETFLNMATHVGYAFVVKDYVYEPPNVIDVRANAVTYPKQVVTKPEGK